MAPLHGTRTARAFHMLSQMRRGAVWTYTSIGVGAAVQVAVTAATARLLDPATFGLVAMANAVLHFGSYFARMGVGRAIVQASEIDDLHLRAGFTMSCLLSAVVAGVMAAAAPLAGAFFQSEDVIPVMRWLSLSFFMSGLGATGRALLQRRLHFRATGLIEIASYALGYGLPALLLASSGYGVWSLVAAAVGQQVVASFAYYALTRHPVRPTLNAEAHRRLLGFGATVSGISFLEFLNDSLDSLMIGRYGAPAHLGLYNRAFTLANLPLYRINAGLAKVLFPVLSGGRGDREAFRHALVRVTMVAGRVVLPIGAGMAVAAPELVSVVLGNQWLDAVPLLAILALGLSMNILAVFPGTALESLGVLRGKMFVQLANAVVLGGALLFVVLALPFDLVRIGSVIAVAHAVRTSAYFVLAVRAGALRSGDVARLGVVAFGCAAVTAGVIGSVVAVSRSVDFPDVLTLLLAIASGAVTCAAFFWNELVGLLRGSAIPSDRDGTRILETEDG